MDAHERRHSFTSWPLPAKIHVDSRPIDPVDKEMDPEEKVSESCWFTGSIRLAISDIAPVSSIMDESRGSFLSKSRLFRHQYHANTWCSGLLGGREAFWKSRVSRQRFSSYTYPPPPRGGVGAGATMSSARTPGCDIFIRT